MVGHRESPPQDIFRKFGRVVVRSAFVGVDDPRPTTVRRNRSFRNGCVSQRRIQIGTTDQLSRRIVSSLRSERKSLLTRPTGSQ
jgi:hypothetical protein